MSEAPGRCEFSLMLFGIGMAIVIWGRKLLIDDLMRESAIIIGSESHADFMLVYAGAGTR